MTLGIMPLKRMTINTIVQHNYAQHNDTQNIDVQNNNPDTHWNGTKQKDTWYYDTQKNDN
jgi:hypothetical protein